MSDNLLEITKIKHTGKVKVNPFLKGLNIKLQPIYRVRIKKKNMVWEYLDEMVKLKKIPNSENPFSDKYDFLSAILNYKKIDDATKEKITIHSLDIHSNLKTIMLFTIVELISNE